MATSLPADERRSSSNRRSYPRIAEAISRRAERRAEQRRDSPRVPMLFWVRDLDEGGSYQERKGELSLEGATWMARERPHSGTLEVRFRIPRVAQELRVAAKLIRTRAVNGGFTCRVIFPEMSALSQLALARFLDRGAEH